ncbi:MAG: hypothetical protein H0U77_05840 [Nocardioidaceae bacterium]|nr:hypothetical protein [Nocardioidaceae bacterium]
MATGVEHPGRAQIGVRTLRQDRWWQYPLTTGAILAFFVVYATVRIFQRDDYWADAEHYLTPLYSPCISDSCVDGSAHFGTPLPELPVFIPIAVITFVVLAGFRGTCYYYRKAGYRSLFFSPAACAVPEPHRTYSGETKFPLNLLNYHRYFFYGALVFTLINLYDGVLAFQGTDGGVGMGLGTVVIWVNLVLLGLYTLSCHACRHIVGGRLRSFSKHPMRYRYWTFVSRLNARHGTYAMASLFTVIGTDAYIMAISAGWFDDPRFF